MIIVEQNKNEIINFENLLGIYIGSFKNRIIAYASMQVVNNGDIQTTGETLAEYATEERAKAVLQEIIQAYIAGEKCYCMPKE